MAVMTSEHSERVAIEQKTQPVPSSEKMALDLDINGTSNPVETNLDHAPVDSSLNQKYATSSPSPSNDLFSSTTTVNGSANVDAFSNNTVATSTSDLTPPADAPPATGKEAPAADASLSDRTPEITAAVDSAVDAAIDSHLGNSTVPPIVRAQKSDLRDGTISPAGRANSITPENNNDADLPIRAVDEAEVAPGVIMDPANPDAVDVALKLQRDTEMADAPEPPSQNSKISREREDDDEAGPSAKRTKTKAGELETKLPLPNTPTAATNGNSSSTKAEDPITPYQIKEIVKVIRNVLRTQNGKNFRGPVDVLWPAFAEAYAAKVPNPIDLGIIEKKVKEGSYRNWETLRMDIRLIHNNSVLFNGADHTVTKAAREVKDTIMNKTSGIASEPVQAPKPAKKAAPKRSTPSAESAPKPVSTARRGSRSAGANTAPKGDAFALPPSGVPIIRRDSHADGRPKRDIHPPKNKDLPYSSVRPKNKKNATELKFCEIVLNEMKKPKYHHFSSPFMVPVDPVALGIPNYFSVIKNPMDISTISDKLNSGFYQKAADFEKDVRQIFANCFKFNPQGNPVNEWGKQFEELFNSQWDKKAQYITEHTPAAVSPSSSAESEDDESEEEAEPEQPPPQPQPSAAANRLIDEQAKLIALMGQKNANKSEIEMQQEIVQMLQKKVEDEKAHSAAPKKPAKKPKNTASKAPKKSAPVKKEKSSAAGGKKAAPRPRYMGTIEKEIVSAGIGLLPENTQDRVMELIQGDAPDAKADDDGSLELDIESLTEASLWEIYGMIEKYLPDTVKNIRGQKEADRVRPRAPTQPKQKKKNKPMSKSEQERKIEHLKRAVTEFERQGSGSQEPVIPTVEQGNDTSGDETSDSEEE